MKSANGGNKLALLSLLVYYHFLLQVQNCGVMNNIMNWVKFKAQVGGSVHEWKKIC